MFGNREGSLLLEVLIAMAILAMVGAIALFSLRPRTLQQERRSFIDELNNLLSFARQSALREFRLHRVVFDLDHKKIFVEKERDGEAGGKEVFVPVPSSYRASWTAIPDQLEIQNMTIEGSDEMAGKRTHEIWFYIMPDGTTQEVIMQLSEKEFVLNPFSARLYPREEQ